MKFLAGSILTAGLLLATAAAVVPSIPLVKAFALLAEDNILSKTPKCGTPNGTITFLSVTDCLLSGYPPCKVQKTNSYTLTITLTCGANHGKLDLQMTIPTFLGDLEAFTAPSDKKCNAGETVTVTFSFPVDSSFPNGRFDLDTKVMGDKSTPAAKVQTCQKLSIEVVDKTA